MTQSMVSDPNCPIKKTGSISVANFSAEFEKENHMGTKYHKGLLKKNKNKASSFHRPELLLYEDKAKSPLSECSDLKIRLQGNDWHSISGWQLTKAPVHMAASHCQENQCCSQLVDFYITRPPPVVDPCWSTLAGTAENGRSHRTSPTVATFDEVGAFLERISVISKYLRLQIQQMISYNSLEK